ncbi:MAG: C1 family peptidase [Bacteroidales bacterium]|jgi:bleomycin hydrolase|nr:C1 family peptidase [Bacteroidales bacterium]MDD2813092.1 C1 family peptidase [Bacteroidales bacterium]MDD3385619.1 C1 family peptidase [Bacteroidales bacterium]MDD3810649.1 C1 family peptidase [Bacteroidales bacterium]MDD3871294.1 C1 family peptidase [Bacteroidales bacterium]
MKKMTMKLALLFILLPAFLAAQDSKETQPGFEMSVIRQAPTTSVKSQASTSTCWCFATTSMLESELLRMGKGEIGLSEMFTVRHVYVAKAENYVRFHGTSNFAEGGEQHDVLNSIRKNGIVPRDVYEGLEYGEPQHRHGEISTVLSGIVKEVVRNRNGKLTPVWLTGFNGVLDAYFGELPLSFSWDGQMFTPKEFANHLGINPDDYIMISSFNHHPFYEEFVIEIPDNWAQEPVHNVPIDELMEVIDYSLEKGISISWAADITGLRFNEGFGRIMEEGADINDPAAPEKTIGQEDRQEVFDNYNLTDDHAMHLVGLATDQFGHKYYMEKNSWGDGGKFKGFSYMSAPFMRLRTVSIMVHKDGIPSHIAKKIGLIN